jgi:hypothetical protein
MGLFIPAGLYHKGFVENVIHCSQNHYQQGENRLFQQVFCLKNPQGGASNLC